MHSLYQITTGDRSIIGLGLFLVMLFRHRSSRNLSDFSLLFFFFFLLDCNLYSYRIFDRLVWGGISRHINQWRKNELGLGSISYKALKSREHPFLYNFSPRVVPKPKDWKSWIYLTGYWYLEPPTQETVHGLTLEAIKAQIPAGLESFIEDSRAQSKSIVYIGFGSVSVVSNVFLIVFFL